VSKVVSQLGGLEKNHLVDGLIAVGHPGVLQKSGFKRGRILSVVGPTFDPSGVMYQFRQSFRRKAKRITLQNVKNFIGVEFYFVGVAVSVKQGSG